MKRVLSLILAVCMCLGCGVTTLAWTLSYDVDGAQGTKPADSAYDSGDVVTVAAKGNLTKAGYTFGGWDTVDSGTLQPGATFKMPNKDVTLTAKWTANAVNKSDLKTAITAANAELNKRVVTTKGDGSDVEKGKPCVTKAVYDAYKAAIASAQEAHDLADADQSSIDAALADLKKANQEFLKTANQMVGTKTDATSADKTKLTAAITAADALYKSVYDSEDGKDVPATEKWANKATKSAYYDAIAKAKVVQGNANATQTAVDAAVTTLATATAAFDKASQPGTKPDVVVVDKTKLSDAVKAAQELVKTPKVSTNGKDVVPAEKWVTSTVKSTYVAAIDAAKKVASDMKATQKTVDAAVTTLAAATKAFEGAMKAGLYKETQADQVVDQVIGEIENADPKTDEGKKVINDAVKKILDAGTKEELAESNSFVENLYQIGRQYAAANNITVKDPDTAKIPDELKELAGLIDIDGAALSTEKGGSVQLTVATPEAPVSEAKLNKLLSGDKQTVTKQVQVDITLNVSELKAPIRLYIPVPESINMDKLVLFHQHGSSVTRIPFTEDGGRIHFVVTGLSTFVMAEVEPKTTSGGGSTGGGGGGDSTPRATTTTTTTVTTPVNTNAKPAVAADVTSATAKAIAAAATTGAKTVNVVLNNVSTITPAILKSVTDAAAKAGVAPMIFADTISKNIVTARLYVNPAKYTLATNLDLSVNVGNPAVEALFAKYFTNKIQVVTFGQKGSFGMEIETAVKLDLTGLDAKALHFYSYNPVNNQYLPIANPKSFVDANGYLHFVTNSGDSVLITGSPLTKK